MTLLLDLCDGNAVHTAAVVTARCRSRSNCPPSQSRYSAHGTSCRTTFRDWTWRLCDATARPRYGTRVLSYEYSALWAQGLVRFYVTRMSRPLLGGQFVVHLVIASPSR